MAESELAIPGVVYVGPKGRLSGAEHLRHVIHTGAAAGWMKPRGIREWEREVSVIKRDQLTDAIRRDLGATLPEEQIPAAKLPLTSRAAKESPLMAVAQNLVEKLVEKGVRVHTIGFDKISGGFYYFAEGGGESVRIQGDLIEMISPALGDGGSSDLESCLDGVIDRMLVDLSNGVLTEGAVELAEALPRLATDGRGAADCDLDAFEAGASKLHAGSLKYEQQARALLDKLANKTNGAQGELVPVPLYGEAQRDSQASMLVDLGGKQVTLKPRDRWWVSGVVKDEPAKAAVEAKAAKPAAKVAQAAATASTTNGKTPKPAGAAAAAATAKAATTPAAKAKVEAKPEPKVEAKAPPKEEAKPATEAAKVEAAPVEAKAAPKAEKKEEEPVKAAPKAEKVSEEPAAAKESKKEEPAKEAAKESPKERKDAKSERAPAKAKEKSVRKVPEGDESEPMMSTQPSARRQREMEEAAQGGSSTKLIIGVVVALVLAFVLYKMFMH
jgi:hypothetical protein